MARGIWKSPKQKERERLSMASRLDVARVICQRGETGGRERTESSQ